MNVFRAFVVVILFSFYFRSNVNIEWITWTMKKTKRVRKKSRKKSLSIRVRHRWTNCNMFGKKTYQIQWNWSPVKSLIDFSVLWIKTLFYMKLLRLWPINNTCTTVVCHSFEIVFNLFFLKINFWDSLLCELWVWFPLTKTMNFLCFRFFLST